MSHSKRNEIDLCILIERADAVVALRFVLLLQAMWIESLERALNPNPEEGPTVDAYLLSAFLPAAEEEKDPQKYWGPSHVVTHGHAHATHNPHL